MRRVASSGSFQPVRTYEIDMLASSLQTSLSELGVSYVDDRGFVGVSIKNTRSNYGTVAEPEVSIDLDQTRTAAEALRQAPVGALRVLACHHPLVEMIGAPMTGDVKRGEAAALIFVEAGVDLIMTGHVHVPFALPINETPEFWGGGGGLYSTAPDYLAFLQMILGGGQGTNGARILAPETLALMGTNQIGDLPLRKLDSQMPFLTSDLEAGLPIGLTEDAQWGLGFAINPKTGPNGRSIGSLAWAGLANTYYWADPEAGIAGVLMTQLLPFADPAVLALFKDFERAVYAA